MFQRIQASLLADERGLTTVEYVIVLCLIVAVAVEAWGILGKNVKGYVEDASGAIDAQIVTQ